jgi:hypothetical protein
MRLMSRAEASGPGDRVPQVDAAGHAVVTPGPGMLTWCAWWRQRPSR